MWLGHLENDAYIVIAANHDLTFSRDESSLKETARNKSPSRDDSPMFLTSPFTFMLITVIDLAKHDSSQLVRTGHV